jgi:hypothetical protein
MNHPGLVESSLAPRRRRLALLLAGSVAPAALAACTNFGDLQKGEPENPFAFDASYSSLSDDASPYARDASVWTYAPSDAAADTSLDGDAIAEADVDEAEAAPADASPDATTSVPPPNANPPTADVATVDAAGACRASPGCSATPTKVVMGGPALETGVGGNVGGGYPVDEMCAANEVVIGFNVTSSPPTTTYLQSVEALCGTLSVTGSAPSYAVGVASAEALLAHGSIGSVFQTATCPTGQMVVGFGGRSGFYIDQIALVCAPLTIATAPGGYALSVGATTAVAAVGGSGGSPFQSSTCPAGQVAVGDFGSAGTELDAYGLKCRTPQFASSTSP